MIFFYLYNVSNCEAYQYTQSNKMLSIHRRVMACRDDDSFILALNRHSPSSAEQIFPLFSQLRLQKYRRTTPSCNQTRATRYGRSHSNRLRAAKVWFNTHLHAVTQTRRWERTSQSSLSQPKEEHTQEHDKGTNMVAWLYT